MDTGASCTSVSRTVIAALGLLPIGKQPVGGMHGMRPTYLYQFEVVLTFPIATRNPRQSAPPGPATFSVLGAEFVPGQAPFEVLLGRDVLCNGILTMAFDGRMTFCI